MNKNHQFSLTIGKKGTGLVVFSVPQTNHYQDISKLEINKLRNWEVKNIGGNKVGIFSLNDVDNKVTISFTHSPKSVTKRLNGRNYDVMLRLYEDTLNYLAYGKPIDGLYTYRQAMKDRVTDCGGFSTYLMHLLQKEGITTRLVSGFLIKNNWYSDLFSNFDFCTLNFKFLIMHAWMEAQLPDKSWFPMDPSIEWRRRKGLTKRQGGFGHIPADRLAVSFGHNFNLTIDNKKYKIDILQLPLYI